MMDPNTLAHGWMLVRAIFLEPPNFPEGPTPERTPLRSRVAAFLTWAERLEPEVTLHRREQSTHSATFQLD